MAVMRYTSKARGHYRSSGGKLAVPRTPVEKVLLEAKRLKMKSDFLKRQAERER